MQNIPMASGQPQRPAEQKPVAGRSLWSDAMRRLWGDRSAIICLIIIVIYAMVAIGAWGYGMMAEHYRTHGTPQQAANWPAFQEMKDYNHLNEPPSLSSWRNWLGTDWSGRSVLIKTILGAKVSMAVGLMANIIAVPLGMLLGAMGGFFGGRFFRGGVVDDMIVWLFSTLASIPSIILLFAIKFAFKGIVLFEGTWYEVDLSGIHGVYIALGMVSWIGTCRLVRAEVMKIRELDYVMAAKASGRGNFAILLRHVMPNVFHLGIINFSLGFVGAVQAEVILSYLGLGVAVGTPSWGTMINSARQDLFAGRWWELTAAVGAMFVLVLALNIFGDRLRDALDPRLKNV